MEVLHSRENAINFFQSYVQNNKQSLKGKQVYDLSAGTGFIANIFHQANASVHLYDLFPDNIKYIDIKCQKINLEENFPIENAQADVVILSETIECLPNHAHLFKEVSRILKPTGIFILTTPNPSSLRSKFSQFLMESEHYSRPLVDETEAYAVWPGTNNGYYGKIFISGILRIRLLAALRGLNIKKIHKSPFSSTAFLFLIFYPLIYFFSWRSYMRRKKESPQNELVYRSIFHTNTSLTVLLSKHLIVEFVKK